MTKTSLLARLTTVAFVAILFIPGCKKESSNTLSTQEEGDVAVYSTESEIESQFVFDDVFNNVLGVNNDLGIGGVGIFGRVGTLTEKTDSLPLCVKVSITPVQPTVFPKTVVLDFGAGCNSHGHLRSGKITTVYTGRLSESGKSATTTFDNFKIDSLVVEGTQKITNSTVPGSNQRQFTVEVTNAKLTRPDGNYEEWAATHVNTQIEGNGTPLPADDIFRITGNSYGKTRHGNLLVSWTSEIGEPLVKKFSCRWFSKGTLKTVRNGLPSNTPWVGLLDFGNGTCDNTATLTINGNVRQITLH